jgi:hypothetical protein
LGFPFPNGVTSYLVGGLFLGMGLMVMVLALGVKAGASSVLSSTLTDVTPLKAERSSRQWRLLRDLGLLLVMAAALAVTTIGFRLAPRLRQTTLLGLPFPQEVKPMLPSIGIGNGPVLIGLAGMFVGAYLQGVLAEGRPKLQG